MFCSECGNKIDDGNKFCTSCGCELAKYSTGAATKNKTTEESSVSGVEASLSPKKKSSTGERKYPITIMAVVAGILAIVFLGLLWSALFNKGLSNTVDLQKYVTVSFEGPNGDGIAKASIDYEGLSAEIIKKAGSKSDGFTGDTLTDNLIIGTAVLDADVSADKYTGLSNGDKITIYVDINPIETSKTKLKYVGEEFVVKVKGLK